MSKIQAIIDAHEALKAAIIQASSEHLPDYFSEVFDADPRIHAVVWGQWAPYFNDGSPCVFGLNYEVPIRAKGFTDSPYGDPTWGSCGFTSDELDAEPLLGAHQKAIDLLEALPLDFLKSISADGVIVVTRDSVSISDCDHD